MPDETPTTDAADATPPVPATTIVGAPVEGEETPSGSAGDTTETYHPLVYPEREPPPFPEAAPPQTPVYTPPAAAVSTEGMLIPDPDAPQHIGATVDPSQVGGPFIQKPFSPTKATLLMKFENFLHGAGDDIAHDEAALVDFVMASYRQFNPKK